jgi:Skp family chaperone for outer membrane proteins
MTLKTKLGKADHDALDETLKSLYVPDGEGFKLDADFEDVDGLKAKRDELLGKLTDAQKLAKQFEGLDPEAARNALAKLNEIEDGQLIKKQQFDELFTKKKSEWDAEKEAMQNRINAQTKRQAEQDLATKLINAGVKAKRAEDLAIVLTQKHIKYVEDNGDVTWKTIDGLESVDLDKYIPALKETKGDYFESTAAIGSGATGSSNNNGGNATTMPHAQFKSMDVKAQAAFIKSGGKPVD